MDSLHAFRAERDDPDPLIDLLVHLEPGSVSEVPRMVVFGDVDTVNAARLHKDFIEVLRHHQPSRIEMDFHGVNFLDSAGIRVLLLCEADARQVGCRITLTDPQPPVRQVLRMTGLLEHFGLAGPGTR